MPDFTSKEKIIVNVSRGSENTENQNNILDKPVFPEHKRPRGFRRAKKGGYINFYDLGYIFDDFQNKMATLPFIIKPIFQPNLQPSFPEFLNNIVRGFIADDYLTRDQLIFNKDINEWETLFHRFNKEKGSLYNVQIFFGAPTQTLEYFSLSQNEDKWTDEGLKVDATLVNQKDIRILSGQEYKNVNGVNTEIPITHLFEDEIIFKSYEYIDEDDGQTYQVKRNHVTDTRFYSDPESNFKFSAEMDIFLFPTPFISKGESRYEEFPGQVNSSRYKLLNYFYTIYPRNVVLNEDDEQVGEGNYYHDKIYRNNGVLRTFNNTTTATEEDFYLALDGVNFARYNFGEQPRAWQYGLNPYYGNNVLAESFPPPATIFGNANVNNAFAPFFQTDFRPVDFRSYASDFNTPYLVAVIKQKDKFYYVWSNPEE